MVSVLPGQRVPRHRLIRNLTEMGKFDQAQTEIRIFEKDFNTDAPVTRLKIELLVAHRNRCPGLMLEDRLAILEQARELAVISIRRYSHAKAVFSAYCKVGFNILKLCGSADVFDDAIQNLERKTRKRLGAYRHCLHYPKV